MRRAAMKATLAAIGLLTLFVGVLFASDLTLVLGINIVEYKDPTHTKDVGDALISSDLAPLIHLLLFIVGVLLFRRLKREERQRAEFESQ